jgi:hypothetical protein
MDSVDQNSFVMRRSQRWRTSPGINAVQVRPLHILSRSSVPPVPHLYSVLPPSDSAHAHSYFTIHFSRTFVQCKSASHHQQQITLSLLIVLNTYEPLPFWNQLWCCHLLTTRKLSRMSKGCSDVVIPKKKEIKELKVWDICFWLSALYLCGNIFVQTSCIHEHNTTYGLQHLFIWRTRGFCRKCNQMGEKWGVGGTWSMINSFEVRKLCYQRQYFWSCMQRPHMLNVYC